MGLGLSGHLSWIWLDLSSSFQVLCTFGQTIFHDDCTQLAHKPTGDCRIFEENVYVKILPGASRLFQVFLGVSKCWVCLQSSSVSAVSIAIACR